MNILKHSSAKTKCRKKLLMHIIAGAFYLAVSNAVSSYLPYPRPFGHITKPRFHYTEFEESRHQIQDPQASCTLSPIHGAVATDTAPPN